jgi:branched-subunit amino acid aminotransferase/4-amino-4-deoxychorismate lyase
LKYVLYNFDLLPENQFHLPVTNRAFQYNDGAFETMLFVNGKVRFLEDHLARLQKAAKVLQIELPEILFQPETVGLYIEKLLQENQLQGKVRVKLKIWRSGIGLYTPEENAAEVLITTEPQKKTLELIKKADFAKTIRTQLSPYSFFKGPNSLQYVLAGVEKKQRDLDEIILLSSEGYVSECLASNIFWIKNNTVFTPKTETGCVAGIMRQNLLHLFQAENIPIQEGLFVPEELLQAGTVFTTNAAGIKVIRQIGDSGFNPALPPSLEYYSFHYL